MALIAALSTSASADDSGQEKSTLDLDGRLPLELLQDRSGQKHILFWSVPDEAWLEVFQGANVTGMVDDNHSYFKRIVADGRQWQWRNSGFVPLVADEAVPAGTTSDADFEDAIGLFADDLAELPENSPANMTFQLETGAGEEIKAIRLASTSICLAGGSQCPLVILREGHEPQSYLISLESSWGFFESGDALFVEYQQPTSVVQINLETGEESQLEMIPPRIALSPPKEPRHVE